MKKITSFALAFVLLFSLAACSAASKDKKDDDTTLEVTNPQGYEDITAPPADAVDTKNDPSDESGEDTTAEDTTDSSDEKIASADDAIKAARAFLGESDPDTGYKYAYSYNGMMTDNGVLYFKVRVSWYIEEQERYSLCGELLVNEDGEVRKYNW
ncbi:MAG: hypothetical protein E7575_01680 [Ruminococcaceae bacterium]|nr:hypothetical protein [Oscillospiraceae bacterium]